MAHSLKRNCTSIVIKISADHAALYAKIFSIPAGPIWWPARFWSMRVSKSSIFVPTDIFFVSGSYIIEPAEPSEEQLFTSSDLHKLITELQLNKAQFIEPSQLVIGNLIKEGSSAFIYEYDFLFYLHYISALYLPQQGVPIKNSKLQWSKSKEPRHSHLRCWNKWKKRPSIWHTSNTQTWLNLLELLLTCTECGW